MSSQVILKSAEEFAKMQVAGKLAADVLEMIAPHVRPGVTTGELDQLCHDFIVNEQQAIPAPLNYGHPPFPKSVCTSLNHVVCHGIPGERVLKKGDCMNIDVTVIKDGYHGDTSNMFFVGEPKIQAKRLCQVTRECLLKAIEIVRPGTTLGDIGAVIQEHAEKNHYSVVRDFCGHGIGTGFHEAPQVLHYGKRGQGLVLEEGMCFTIEPMINAGKHQVKILPDQWTAVTRDRSLSAQYEHTIGVTGDGCVIFTKRSDEHDL